MRRVVLAAGVLLTAYPSNRLTAQHPGHEMQMPMPMNGGVLGIPEARAGSGTAWLPDSAPMHAAHFRAGQWTLMVHGIVAPLYDTQGGPRGDDQFNVINWGMLTARRQVGNGSLALRIMASADPWTVGPRGYPLLLQSGETYQGAPLVDRQHPHDLWIELAALWERPIAADLAASLYVAAVGEPAVGPPAFQHRPSAQSDPFAPLGHHWQDATHITYGAMTVGVFSRDVKVEASAFNGREPDARRTDFDFRKIDSYSVRVAANRGGRWSLSAWYAYLASPEELYPGESIHRYGVAALTAQGRVNAAFVWGANAHVGSTTSHSLLAEGDVELLRGHHVFTRLEYVRKSGRDLAAAAGTYDIGSIVLGYVKDWGAFSAGVRGSLGLVPASLDVQYGSRTPRGAAVYGRWRPR